MGYNGAVPRVFLTKRAEFPVAHQYQHPLWDREKNEEVFGQAMRLHGHNYLVEVTIGGEVEPRTGMVLNLSDLKRAVLSMLEAFDHKNLNEDSPHFVGLIPTTERLTSILWGLLEPRLTGLTRIRLYESPGLFVDYSKDHERHPVIAALTTLTRVYRFSSAHRLFSPAFTDEENRAIYGKCSSLHGHGHDYTLEVTLAWPPEQPMIPRWAAIEMDPLVAAQVAAAFDHRHLNHDVEEFRRLVPTAENILIVTWERLVKRLPPGLLNRLKLVETRDNTFEYYG